VNGYPQDLGVGISQLVPIVVLANDAELVVASIEQPELHIHPGLQTRLGDLFIHGIRQSKKLFVLETHSEHLLLRLLRRIRETSEGELPAGSFPTLLPNEVSVYYIENDGVGTQIRHLRIDETGEFIDRWPHGFFEERAEELF